MGEPGKAPVPMTTGSRGGDSLLPCVPRNAVPSSVVTKYMDGLAKRINKVNDSCYRVLRMEISFRNLSGAPYNSYHTENKFEGKTSSIEHGLLYGDRLGCLLSCSEPCSIQGPGSEVWRYRSEAENPLP